MSHALSQRYHDYVSELFAREDATLRYVRQQTAARGLPQISLEPNEAKLLQLLVRLSGACAGRSRHAGRLQRHLHRPRAARSRPADHH